ncbi:VAMP-associated protein involved in inositol metabolism [Handroanthus impetiginosus]|uniref:VAMP-associated protein involved in inositol metabolism n=1 Tax=Handroanthus impetiginosus TaxID=429701 RepID=A0A2G9HEU3_9LAMI|nr:VAMP-associated protein involved in inositol metabolism [Handroanthus impetiginosus]
MNTQLVEIQPRELKFIFEVKKQCSCAVHLANVTDQYVAFKVKTTSPKKYCVRPNIGIIKPKSTCDFTVTMQAQKSASLEMQCKDKFLIQSTVVPFGITEDEITPGMFARESLKYIEETKLRVVLTSPSSSPVKPPADVVFEREASYEPKESHSPVLLPVNGVIKQEHSRETSLPKDKLQNGVENFPPPDTLIKKADAIKNFKNLEESRSIKDVENMKPVPAKNEELFSSKDEESKQVKDVEEEKLKLTKDIEELRSKISALDSKLVEASYTIEKLKEEKSNCIHEKEKLKQELAILRTKGGARKIQAGFPPLFVCMVALISLLIGWLY